MSLITRKWKFKLYLISFVKMVIYHGLLDEENCFHIVLYIATMRMLQTIRVMKKKFWDSYFFKDILMREQIKKPDKLLKLLQAVAFQVGKQLSYSGLGQISGLDSKTIEKYMLLKQSFVFFLLGPFSRINGMNW